MNPRLPQISSREIIKFLKTKGFVDDRQKGSHLTLWHPERNCSITVPVHKGKDLGRGLVVRLLKDVGFEVEEFIRQR